MVETWRLQRDHGLNGGFEEDDDTPRISWRWGHSLKCTACKTDLELLLEVEVVKRQLEVEVVKQLEVEVARTRTIPRRSVAPAVHEENARRFSTDQICSP